MKHRRKLFIAFGALAFATLAILGYLIWSDYRQEVRSARTSTRDYAAILETRLDATLRRANANLLVLAHLCHLAQQTLCKSIAYEF